VGKDKTLTPVRYFIIIPALFGNGQSSSPSNTSLGRQFPKVSLYDNVGAQYRLVAERLGVRHARAVVGWSMGAQQTYQWATQYPDFMDLIVPFCGSARTSLHNQIFLERVKSALLASKGGASVRSGNGGSTTAAGKPRTWSEEEKLVGLRAFGRVYA
jgi:homoserine acetyltransferase